MVSNFFTAAVWVSLEEVVQAQDENTVVDLLIQGYNPIDTTSFGVSLFSY